MSEPRIPLRSSESGEVVKIRLGTIVADDRVRRALRHRIGGLGRATRAEVKNFYLTAADATLDEVCAEYDALSAPKLPFVEEEEGRDATR